MPISVDHVKQIQTFTIDLGELIKKVNPVTETEWDAFEKMVSAHKNMTKIDTGELLQMPLPFDKKPEKETKPRKDCPRCKGSGTFVDPDSPSDPGRPCNCKDVEKSAWPAVKADWMKVLVTPGD